VISFGGKNEEWCVLLLRKYTLRTKQHQIKPLTFYDFNNLISTSKLKKHIYI